MKCHICGNRHFSGFLEEDRQDSIIVTCRKCGAVVETFNTATIEEKQLLAGSE